MVVEARAAVVVVVGEERRREALEARWKGSSEDAILLRPYVLDTRRPSDGAKQRGREGRDETRGEDEKGDHTTVKSGGHRVREQSEAEGGRERSYPGVNT